MYKRKLIVLISLIGIGIGTYFIFNFYNIFFGVIQFLKINTLMYLLTMMTQWTPLKFN